MCHDVAARGWGANGAEQVGIESQSLLRAEKKKKEHPYCDITEEDVQEADGPVSSMKMSPGCGCQQMPALN